MRILRQLIKIIVTPSELRATTINNRGNALAIAIDLKDKPEIKKLVDDFSAKLLDILEKEIG